MSVMQRVPAQNVGEVVQAFVDDDKTRVVCEKNSDGTWTVTGTPDR